MLHVPRAMRFASFPVSMYWPELESHLQLFGRQSGVALLIPACDL